MLLLSVFHFDNDMLLLLFFDNQLGCHVKMIMLLWSSIQNPIVERNICKGLYEGLKF